MVGSASISTVPRSSSVTVTVTVASTPTLASVRVTATSSSFASSSACAVTVTVCAVFQSVVVNVSDALSTLAAPVSALATATVVVAPGSLSSFAVKVPTLPPPVVASVSVRAGTDTVASSDGTTATDAVAMVPARSCAAAPTVTATVRAVSKSVSS